MSLSNAYLSARPVVCFIQRMHDQLKCQLDSLDLENIYEDLQNLNIDQIELMEVEHSQTDMIKVSMTYTTTDVMQILSHLKRSTEHLQTQLDCHPRQAINDDGYAIAAGYNNTYATVVAVIRTLKELHDKIEFERMNWMEINDDKFMRKMMILYNIADAVSFVYYSQIVLKSFYMGENNMMDTASVINY